MSTELNYDSKTQGVSVLPLLSNVLLLLVPLKLICGLEVVVFYGSFVCILCKKKINTHYEL